ncbi:hypothetical protein TRAPUB_1540, partial [Trametes pubescens]
MARLRDSWLSPDWADAIRATIFSTPHDEEKSLESWITFLELQNSYLRGTDIHLDENTLRSVISASACSHIRLLTLRGEYRNIEKYSSWKSALIAQDNERLVERAQLYRHFERFTKARSATTYPSKGAPKSRSGGNSGGNSGGSSSQS